MTAAPDPPSPVDLVTRVSEIVDPGGRAAGTEGERLAQERFAGKLHAAGFDARVEGAVCGPPQHAVLVLHGVAGLLACLLVPADPVWGGFAAVGLGISFWGELRGRPRLLRRLLPKRISGNVVARVPREGARGRIVLTAHVDTAFGSPLLHPLVQRILARPSEAEDDLHPGTLVLGAAVVQGVAALLGMLGVGPIAVASVVAAAALVYGGLLAFAIEQWRAPPVPGAVSNASGLAVVEALAERFAAVPPEHAELWVLGTGDREPEAQGMAAFLRRFGRVLDRETTLFVNVDAVGRAELHFAVSEGRWERVAYRPTLPGLAERVAAAGFDHVRSAGLVGTTDAGPATRAGYRAITITALEDGGRPEVVHTADDDLQAVDPEALVAAYRFTEALVVAADEFLGDSAGRAPKHVGAAPLPED